LEDCAGRLPLSISVVLYRDTLVPTDDQRLEWTKRYGGLFSLLVRGLLDENLATERKVNTSGPAKVRVSPVVPWKALVEAYDQADADYSAIFASLRRS
jgi:hypothetical protein